MLKKRPASVRKISANRRNALESTGPKTPRGKATSRTNALKHGLFAMEVFIDGGARRENPSQYQALISDLVQHYLPVGVAEELEVQRIAACWWRVHRAWRYENSEIAHEHMETDIRRDELLDSKVKTPLSPIHDAIDLLTRIAAELEANGTISPALQPEIETSNEKFKEVWSFVQLQTNRALGRSKREPGEENRAATLFLLAHTRVAVHILQCNMKSLAADAQKLSHDRFAVPSGEVLDRLLRAEAAAERNLNRAMDRLERLQRRRLGEIVPPPISVRLGR